MKSIARNNYNGLSRKYRSEYLSYIAMIHRCHNPKCKAYNNYGARGILVCESWKSSFENFLKDIGLKPSKNYSLERIDVNLGYFAENCKWATRIEQENNKRRTIRIEINGELLTVRDLADRLKTNRDTIAKRIKSGVTDLGLLGEKRLYKNNLIKIEYMGMKKSFKEWSLFFDIPEQIIRARYYRNLPVEKLFC